MEVANNTILVVDDEVSLVEIIVHTLLSSGYQVLEAFSGEEAFEKVQDSANDISLILSDVKMPGMGGAGLIKALREHNYEIPVILLTGYSNLKPDDAFASCVGRILKKPFESEDLIEYVNELLLPVEQRWTKSPQQSPHVKLYQFSKDKISEIRFGREGFFLPISSPFPIVGETIAFELDTPDGKVEGLGEVVWARHMKADRLSGVGVWIDTLTESSVPIYKNLISNVAFHLKIPKGEEAA